LKNYHELENTIAEIFRRLGYEVRQNEKYITQSIRREVDMIAMDPVTEQKYIIEVKGRVSNEILMLEGARIKSSLELVQKIEGGKCVPAVVVAYPVGESLRTEFAKAYPDVLLVDIANILFSLQGDTEYITKLKGILDYSTERITPRDWDYSLKKDETKSSGIANELIAQIQNCKAGKTDANSFEEICVKILNYLLSDVCTKLNVQVPSNKNLFRFDAICRIKDGVKSPFCTIVERFFETKYLVFEFKNYRNRIKQTQVYTTEKYLYAKALRRVAIVVARNGVDENADWAAKGCLREEGKLILFLTKKDLISMIKLKDDNDDPTELLMQKVDSLFLNLEK